MQKELQEKLNIAAVGEEISPATAATFMKTYAEAHPTDNPAFHIGKDIIEHILAQPGCCGIRFYNAINEVGQKTLVYVGIDQFGKDILKRVIVGEDGSLQITNSQIGDRAGGSDSSLVWETIKRMFGF